MYAPVHCFKREGIVTEVNEGGRKQLQYLGLMSEMQAQQGPHRRDASHVLPGPITWDEACGGLWVGRA